MKPLSSVLLPLAFILLSTVCTAPAFAHKVIVFAWIEDGQVYVEAGFGGKRPAKNCEIQASDHDGNIVYKGTTDDQGRHSFAIPKGFASDMVIELSAGPGHKGTWTLGADEFNNQSEKGQQVDTPDEKIDPPPVNPVNQGTDPLRIIAGIAIIFGLALLVGRLRSKKTPNKKH